MKGSPETRPRPLLLALCLWALSVPGVAAQEDGAEPPARDDPRWTVLDERVGAGEQCLVCGQPIVGKGIVEVRYQGRRFHVSADMLEAFEEDPELYFAKLQARSALFDESSVVPEPMSNRWLGLGLYVLAGLLAAAACGYLAVAKALPPIPWFLAGLVLNVVALGALAVARKGDLSRLPAGVPPGLAKVPQTATPSCCAQCGAPNHPTAARCAGCGAALTPAGEPETARV